MKVSKNQAAKRVKQLRLGKETLHQLETFDLRPAVGGGATIGFTNCSVKPGTYGCCGTT